MGEGRDRQSWLLHELQELLGGLWTFRHPASEHIWCQAELAQWIDNIIDSMTQAGTRHAAHPPGDGSCVQCPALAPHNTSQ